MTPDRDLVERLKLQAAAILEEELDRPAGAVDLQLERLFEKHPFYEGLQAAAFSFCPPGKSDRFFVFAGNVMPMIYRDMGLSLDELWAVHIGVEYFIKMGVTEEKARDTRTLFSYLKMVTTLFQQQLLVTLTSPPKIEKIYTLEDRRQVVGYYTDGEKAYSWIVGDVPHFVYKHRLPPQIVWALHIGKILLSGE